MPVWCKDRPPPNFSPFLHGEAGIAHHADLGPPAQELCCQTTESASHGTTIIVFELAPAKDADSHASSTDSLPDFLWHSFSWALKRGTLMDSLHDTLGALQ